MFAIDFRSREPIYMQIKQQIIKLILTGVLKEDEQLPTVRQVSLDLNVNPNTVQKAYQQLDEAGFIYSLTGKGSFIAPLKNKNEVIGRKITQELSKGVSQALTYDYTPKKIHEKTDECIDDWKNRNA